MEGNYLCVNTGVIHGVIYSLYLLTQLKKKNKTKKVKIMTHFEAGENKRVNHQDCSKMCNKKMYQ